MEDLLQSQIRDSCRLALPEGLKDLMSDISREVLRAQPQNLYQFIADYLSALLVAREHLFIAARVCDDVCKNRCCAELEDELRLLPLSDEDVEKCLEIIKEYFSKGEALPMLCAVKEGNVLQKIVNETDIRQNDLPAIQNAVRCAFLRHQLNKTISIESATDSELDETMLAAKHTLGIYKKVTENRDINYNCVAAKIQAAYRAYSVRRKRTTRYEPHSRKKEDAADKVHFKVKTDQLLEDVVHINTKRCVSKCSSISLAGSFLSLPLYKPYSSLGQPSDIVEVDEIGEKEMEHANFDYVSNREKKPLGNQYREIENKGKKTISFHKFPKVVEPDDDEVSDEADEAEYESEEIDEEVISEQYVDEEAINQHYADGDMADGNYADEDKAYEKYADEDVTGENYADGGVTDEIDSDVSEKQYTVKEYVDRDFIDDLPESPINKGEVTPGSAAISELKRDTESSDSFSEDLDEVQENEAQRIFVSWSGVDAPEANRDNQEETLFVSPADDEDKQVENSVEIKSIEMNVDNTTAIRNMKTIPNNEFFVGDYSENDQV